MAITIRAKFKCSSEKISQVPKDDLKDIAFIGRSNVGKSSLVNMLTNNNGLAKVSGTPGKTKLINHFLINNSWYLVDLPGYGYARVSKSARGEFSKLILDYVLKCEKMHFLFVLVDSRLEPQKIDLRFIELPLRTPLLMKLIAPWNLWSKRILLPPPNISVALWIFARTDAVISLT